MTDDREPFREARAIGKAKHHEQRLARVDLATIRLAIEMLPALCQYHGEQLVRDYGWDRGSYCCETGKPALARRKAEAALERLEASA